MPVRSVEDYLAALGEPERASLQRLRETILNLLPGAEECISYGVPGYRVQGEVVAGFAAAKRHLSYFPHSGSVLPALSEDLEDYSWSKGTLRFDIGSTLPRHLVERLLGARLAQLGSRPGDDRGPAGVIAAGENPGVDDYIRDSEAWPEELAALRRVLLGCGLTEEVKWAKPCYTHEGGNVAILQEMKDFLALMFFKGALLDDPEGVLEDQGPNSRSARRIRFTSVGDVDRLGDTVAALVEAAIGLERSGVKVDPAPEPVPVGELREALERDPALRAAFEALTPGRRREYDLYVSGAKKATTRAARVERCAARILEGKGLRDR